VHWKQESDENKKSHPAPEIYWPGSAILEDTYNVENFLKYRYRYIISFFLYFFFQIFYFLRNLLFLFKNSYFSSKFRNLFKSPVKKARLESTYGIQIQVPVCDKKYRIDKSNQNQFELQTADSGTVFNPPPYCYVPVSKPIYRHLNL